VLNGHAWLTCGETVVTGGAELHRYTELHRLNAKTSWPRLRFPNPNSPAGRAPMLISNR